jgi:protein TonB
MVARIPIDTPPAAVAPARTLEFGSSTGNSPSLSPPIQDARLPSPATGQPDFTWLTDSLRSKVLESQKYSTVARLNGMEGRVVLRVTVKKNGELLIAIATSSGHDLLDQDAMEQVKRLSPLPLQQPLGREQKVLNLPIIYSLNR